MRYYNPFRELESVRREVDRIFNGYTGGSLLSRSSLAPAQINVYENSDDVEVEVLLPGIDPKALDLQVVRNELTISGERRQSEDVKPEAWHRQERAAGKFVRKIALPAEIDPDGVKAEYANGVLAIRLAKSEAARPRRIEVAVA